ncbi:MAG: hypothetical protein ABEH43_06525, partial [Flavobacteriales bacterium]
FNYYIMLSVVFLLFSITSFLLIVYKLKNHKNEYYSQKERSLFFIVYLIFITPVIMILHGVTTFPRTWLYLIIPILYITALFIDHLIRTGVKFIYPLLFSFLIAVLLNYHFKKYIGIYAKEAVKKNELAHYLIDKAPDKIFVNFPAIHATLNYIFDKKNAKIELNHSKNGQINRQRIKEQQYDILISKSKFSQLKGYRKIKNKAIDKDFIVYEKVD